MSDELLIIREHFDKSLHHRDRGLVTVVGLADRIVAGVGGAPFLVVEFYEDRISIRSRLPIQAEKEVEELESGRHYCIRLSKHRKKAGVRENTLLEGLKQPMKPGGGNWPQISFEFTHPESIHASEYYANKIISIVRRKITLSGDNVFLKDPSDKTDLIELATREWRRNKPRFTRKQ